MHELISLTIAVGKAAIPIPLSTARIIPTILLMEKTGWKLTSNFESMSVSQFVPGKGILIESP